MLIFLKKKFQAIKTSLINEYNEKTAPLKEYYLNQDKLTEVSGKGSVTEISKKLFDLIDAL